MVESDKSQGNQVFLSYCCRCCRVYRGAVAFAQLIGRCWCSAEEGVGVVAQGQDMVLLLLRMSRG